jgi:hypothetical protein
MTRITASFVRLSVSFYRILQFVYPRTHRQAYGPLIVQLFQDICRDAYEQRGILGLISLWFRTICDLFVSASAAHLESLGEVNMSLNHTIKPMTWDKVMLVVIPGILFGISRIYYPLGWLALISLFIVVLLALAWLVTQKGLPAWGLLGLGLATSWILLRAGSLGMTELGTRWRLEYSLREMLVSIPVWLVILLLMWRYMPAGRMPGWVWIAFILVIGAFTALIGTSVLATVGFMLLPLALGLPLAQRHGSLASLFVLGTYSQWLFDSDFYSIPSLQGFTFYPIYVLVLSLFFMTVAPLLLLRARSQVRRVAGLLVPAGFALMLGMAVPWLAYPDFHPMRIWLGNMGIALLGLLILALALVIYTKAGNMQSAASSGESSSPSQTNDSIIIL